MRLFRRLRRLRRAGRRRGIALILALAMLSMMVLLAMSFAASAIWTRTSAQVNESITHARHTAETGLQRAIAALKVELNNTTDFTTYYPGTRNFVQGTGTWNDFYYYVSALDSGTAQTDGLGASLSYSRGSIDYLPTSLPVGLPSGMTASWIPVFTNKDIRGSVENVIVGRYAFIIWDESGKIDPNPTTSTTHAEGSEPVLGYTLDEINIRDAGIDATSADRLRPHPAGRAPDGAKWFSLYQMAEVIEASQGTVDQMNDIFFPYRRPDTLESVMEMYDVSTLASASVTDVVDGIIWLDNWQEAGDFDSASDRAKNIAANMIDYCDADRSATTDSSTNPDYWGVEQVPYLTRVQIKVVNTSYRQGNKSIPQLQLQIRPEVINMHGDLSGYADLFRFQGRFRVRWTDDIGQSHVTEVTGADTFNCGVDADGNFGANGYVRATGNGIELDVNESGYEINDRDRYSINNIQVEMVYGRVGHTNGDHWSLGRAEPCAGFAVTSVGDFEYVNFRAMSPGNSINGPGWTSQVGIVNRFQSPYTDATGDCPELWVDYPMFIRNGAMQHLVELGCIMRMEPYDSSDVARGLRTLNLIDYKYNGDHEVPGEYAEAADGVIDNYDGTLEDTEGNGGDRNIIDQVRLGTTDAVEKVLVGRININSPRRDVLEALFKRVDNCQFTDGTDISAVDIDNLVSNIIAHTGSNPLPMGIFSRYRNPPLYGLMFQDSMTALPEMQREYLLMMTQQLVTAEHNYFSAIVIGQAIQDIGGVTIDGTDCEYGVYDRGFDRILAEQKIRAIIYRNAFINRFVLERFEYLED